MNTSSSRSHTQPPPFTGVSTSGDHLWPLFPRDDGRSAPLVTSGQNLALDPPAHPPTPTGPVSAALSLRSASFHSKAHSQGFPQVCVCSVPQLLRVFPSHCASFICHLRHSLRTAPPALCPLLLQTPHRLLPSCAPTPSAHPGSPDHHPQVLPRMALSSHPFSITDASFCFLPALPVTC